MFLIYGITGSALVIVGVVYLYIFLRYLLRSKNKTELIIAISEALITVAIGVFHIYSVIVFTHNSEKPVVNFTNTIDDILLKKDTFEMFFTTKVPDATTDNYDEIKDTMNMENNEETLDSSMFETTRQITDQSLYTEETLTDSTINQKTTPPIEINKTEQFIKNYQTFIKDIIKQKLSNSSIFNQTLAKLKFGPPKVKTSREIQFVPEEDNCFYNIFLENALLLYSFTHCLITLVNNTLQCRKCIETKEESKEDSKNNEPSIESKTDEVLDTSGSASAPVGPLFESSNSKSSNNGPDLKLFEAKSAQSAESAKKTVTLHGKSEKYKLILQIWITWIIPIISVIILYYSSRTEPTLPNLEENIKLKSNFTISPAESNIINLIHNSENVTTNSSEVDNVVNRIYDIVNEVKEKVNQKTTYFTPLMVDVVYFLSHKPRDSKICSTVHISMKVLYFFVFVVGYFSVILYAKITETITKFKNEERAKQQNVCFLTFALLWLPSVLDLFYRMFVLQGDMTILSSIFSAVGNINRLLTMMSNHLYIKRCTNKPNFVNPV